MCLTVPALVLEVEDGSALIEMAGGSLGARRRRRVATRLLPDVAPGDHVLVGLGEILAHLSLDEATAMADDLARVSARPDQQRTVQGGPR